MVEGKLTELAQEHEVLLQSAQDFGHYQKALGVTSPHDTALYARYMADLEQGRDQLERRHQLWRALHNWEDSVLRWRQWPVEDVNIQQVAAQQNKRRRRGRRRRRRIKREEEKKRRRRRRSTTE